MAVVPKLCCVLKSPGEILKFVLLRLHLILIKSEHLGVRARLFKKSSGECNGQQTLGSTGKYMQLPKEIPRGAL